MFAHLHPTQPAIKVRSSGPWEKQRSDDNAQMAPIMKAEKKQASGRNLTIFMLKLRTSLFHFDFKIEDIEIDIENLRLGNPLSLARLYSY